MAKFESIKANSPAAIAASPFKKGGKMNNKKTASQFPTRRSFLTTSSNSGFLQHQQIFSCIGM
ncbi:MAG: hypothetical protein WCJ11_12800, partial [Methylococcaceae bacterium]